MKKRRMLGLFAALTMLTSTFTPAYANQVDLDVTGMFDNDITLGLSLDDVTKESQGDWWKFENNTLTLSGQLPDTSYNNNLAKKAGTSIYAVNKVIIEPDTKAGKSLSYAFWGFSELVSIEGLENLDTSAVTDMDGMFACCNKLTSLDVSRFNTTNVKNMYCMFADCNSLTSIDMAGINTVNVTNKSYMFDDCSSLISLKLPEGFSVTNDMSLINKSDDYKGWAKAETSDIISGTDENAVFNAGTSGEYVRVINNWYKFEDGVLTLSGQLPDTSMYSTLADKAGINSIVTKVVIEPDTKAGKSLAYAFYRFTSLESVEGLENLDTSTVTNMEGMFYFCLSLKLLNMTGINTENVTNMDYMFADCNSLTSLDVSGFNTTNVTNMGYMFFRCYVLTSLDVSGFNTANVTQMECMFVSCRGLTSLDVSGFNTTNVTDMSRMFYDCSGLTSLDVSGFNTANVTQMECMFAGCRSLTSLDISKFYTTNVTNMGSMFYGCKKLTSLDVSGFNTTNVTNMGYMFNGCSNLISLDVSGFNTTNVTSMGSMFYGCNKLTFLDVSGFNTTNVTDFGAMFCGCSGLTYLDVSGFNTKNVTYMYDMFSGCTNLTFLDVSGFSTENAAVMTSMFKGCSSLTSLDLLSFNMTTDTIHMFIGCTGLKSLKLPKGFRATSRSLPNVSDEYIGWAKAGTSDIISGTRDYAEFTVDTAGEYVRIPHDHSYSTPEYTWANDYSTCTAECVCTRCNEKVIEEGIVSDNVILPASCTKKGKTSYTSVFTNELFTTQEKTVENIDTIPHSYSTPEWIWSNDNRSAKAVFACKNCESNNTISAKITETITIQPTEEKEGQKTVTATVTFNGKTYTEKKEVIMPVVEITYPRNVKVEPGNRKMNVTWTPVKRASYYEIYYSSTNISGRIRREANKNGAYISGLENGTYDVFVVAVTTYQTDHGTGMSAGASDVVTVDLKPYYVPCKTQAVESGAINITWSKFDGATRYRIVCVNKDNTVCDTKTTSKFSFKWTGLKNGETYGFYVQPFVNGVYPTFTRTDANDKRYIQWTCPVNSPMITKLSLGNQKVWLYYESVPRATKYYIYYKQKGDTKDTLAGTTTATKFLVTKLKNNVSTEFYVKALVDGKLTPLKRPATRTTRAGMKPTVTATAGQAALKWTKYTDCKASATKYKVVFVDANYKQIDTRETANLAFTWKDKRLVKGNKYGFYVVPYVNGEYIPFGLSHAEDKANVVMFTAK